MRAQHSHLLLCSRNATLGVAPGASSIRITRPVLARCTSEGYARTMRARPILAVRTLAVGLTAAARAYRSPAESMADAANRFLTSLSDSQRTVATFPLASEERLRWAFIPNEMWPRKGITIKVM